MNKDVSPRTVLREVANAPKWLRDKLPLDQLTVADRRALAWAWACFERDSQKPMLLGKGGQIIKAIGSEARAGMETLLDARVHLELHVTVLGEWQDDPKKLNRLGY